MSRSRPGRTAVVAVAFVILMGAAVLQPVGGAQAETAETTESRPAEPPDEQDPPRDLVLNGTIADENGTPIENATVEVGNRWIGEEGHTKGYDSQQTSTNANGHYHLEISEGEIRLSVAKIGYKTATLGTSIENDTTIELSLPEVDGPVVRLHGTVTDDDGEPVPNARVSANPEPRCYDRETENGHGRVCEAHAAERSTSREQDHATVNGEPVDVSYRSLDRYQSTQTDEEGEYELLTRPGRIQVRAQQDGYIDDRATVDASAPEEEVDLELREIPEDSVTIRGVVTDASGDPIEHARVSVSNQAWGHHNSTRTDANGEYELATKPGYALVSISAERDYWIPCEHPEHRDVSSKEDCGRQSRDRGYLSVTEAIQPEADETVNREVALEPAPAPDAKLQGWIVNASSGEAIPNATVRVHNQITNEYGHAETGPDGSYQIDVRAGYYTVRVHADGYYQNATNARVDSGETGEVTLELEPSQTHRYCCVAHAEDRAFERDAQRAGGDGADDGQADESGASRQDEAMESGSSSDAKPAFTGGPGNLGDYDAHTAGEDPESPDETRGSPMPSILLTLAVVAMGAVSIKLWDSYE